MENSEISSNFGNRVKSGVNAFHTKINFVKNEDGDDKYYKMVCLNRIKKNSNFIIFEK